MSNKTECPRCGKSISSKNMKTHQNSRNCSKIIEPTDDRIRKCQELKEMLASELTIVEKELVCLEKIRKTYGVATNGTPTEKSETIASQIKEAKQKVGGLCPRASPRGAGRKKVERCVEKFKDPITDLVGGVLNDIFETTEMTETLNFNEDIPSQPRTPSEEKTVFKFVRPLN